MMSSSGTVSNQISQDIGTQPDIIVAVIDSFTYVLGDFAQVQAQLSAQYKTIPIVDSSGQVVDPEYPKTSPDHIFVQGTLDNEAVISIAFRKSASAADGVGYRWYITGTLGELAITNSEAPWAYGVTANRNILLKLGKEGATEEVDYTSEDTSRAAKLPIPTRNTARIYENFAREGGEVVTFEDALKTHRLLARIAESAGWEV
jgi:predicted dehydrogenase